MQTKQELKEFLLTLKEAHPKMAVGGAISVCKKPGKKYYEQRLAILEYTKHLPEHIDIGTRIYFITHDMDDFSLCKCGCGNKVSSWIHNYLPYHANKCKDVQAKKALTLQKHYGGDIINPSQSSVINEKKKQTYMKHYGAEHYMSSEKGLAEYKKNLKETTGYENNYQRPKSIASVKETWKTNREERIQKRKVTQKENFYNYIKNEKYKGIFELLFTQEEYKGVMHKYPLKCKKCGNILNLELLAGLKCRICNPSLISIGNSQEEIDLVNYINSLGINLISQDRTEIYPLEIDIYCPDYKVGIELDGLYWHSEINGEKSVNYHKNKTDKCNNKNIQLIHIFEDEWVNKQKIVKANLKHLFNKERYKISADKYEIRSVNSELYDKFLEKYHILGKDNSAIKLGAYYKNRLIAVMSCIKTPNNHIIINRVAQVFNFAIEDMHKHFIKYIENNYDFSILSIAIDLRWCNGNNYIKNGFKLVHTTAPSFSYIKGNNTRLIRQKFTVEEWKSFKDLEYDRIWDCGSYLLVKERE